MDILKRFQFELDDLADLEDGTLSAFRIVAIYELLRNEGLDINKIDLSKHATDKQKLKHANSKRICTDIIDALNAKKQRDKIINLKEWRENHAK